MKKSIEHKCISCGNVYYYRKIKYHGLCPVCGNSLLPKGYRFVEMPFGMSIIPDIPMPPVKPPKDEDYPLRPEVSD